MLNLLASLALLAGDEAATEGLGKICESLSAAQSYRFEVTTESSGGMGFGGRGGHFLSWRP